MMASTVPINMKAAPQIRNLIDRAANLLHLNRTEFVLETMVQKAEEVILEQRLLTVDEDRYNRFISALDTPPKKNLNLQKLMESKAPWE